MRLIVLSKYLCIFVKKLSNYKDKYEHKSFDT